MDWGYLRPITPTYFGIWECESAEIVISGNLVISDYEDIPVRT